MKKLQVYHRHKHFCDGHVSVDSDLCSGRPSVASNEANVEHVWESVRSDERKCVCQIASESLWKVGTVFFMMCWTCSVFVNVCYLECWHVKKKGNANEHSGALIDMADKDNKSLNNIITGNETWCFLYSPQTKNHSSEWKSLSSPQSKKFWVHQGNRKVMLDFFFKGLVHYAFISECKTVNKEMYIGVLRHLKDAVRRKLPEKWRMNSGFFLNLRFVSPCIIVQFK